MTCQPDHGAGARLGSLRPRLAGAGRHHVLLGVLSMRGEDILLIVALIAILAIALGGIHLHPVLVLR